MRPATRRASFLALALLVVGLIAVGSIDDVASARPGPTPTDDWERAGYRELRTLHPDDLTTPTPSADPRPTPARSLGLYFDYVRPLGSVATDGRGIPLVPYDGVLRYNPVTISQRALTYYGLWVAHDDTAARTRFLELADWLVAEQKPDGVWEYTFAFGGQPLPWWSAMAQGQAISVLARASEETGKPAYRRAAELSLATFTRPQSSRGVRLVDRGYVWFETYMKPYAPHTLNGFMWALAGLRDAQLAFDSALAERLWNEGLRTLVHELPRFDTGSWSCYSVYYPKLDGCNAATKVYHDAVVFELRAYYRWTGKPIFREYADRFASYPTPDWL